MCDPVSIGYVVAGAVAASALKPKAPGALEQPDPAAERARAETDAAQAANAKTATDKRARAANALALGGYASPLGGSALGGGLPPLPRSISSALSASTVGGPNTALAGGASEARVSTPRTPPRPQSL